MHDVTGTEGPFTGLPVYSWWGTQDRRVTQQMVQVSAVASIALTESVVVLGGHSARLRVLAPACRSGGALLRAPSAARLWLAIICGPCQRSPSVYGCSRLWMC